MALKTESLASMCEAVIDCPHSTPIWTKSGYVVLRNQNIKDGRLDLSEPSFTDEKHFKQRIRRMAPRPGDIVITREAPMGEVCKIPEGLTCCLGQRQVLLRPKADVDTDYLLYALQSPFVQNQIRWNEGTGSTVSNIRIPVLEKIEIPRHDRVETSIAKALGSLDSKIDLNCRINQTLEAMAQAIFKSWFVDFDPVKAKIAAIEQGGDPLRAAMCAISGKTDAELDQMPREHHDQLAATAALFPGAMEESELGAIPKGWVVSDMRSLSEIISKGTTPSKLDLATAKDEPIIPFIKVKDISEAGEIARGNLELIARSIHESSLKRSIIKTNDLLFSIAGTIGRTTFVDSDLNGANLNQAIAFIRLKDKPSHFSLCWLTLRSIETQNLITSKVVQAVQANASLANVGDIPIRLPSSDVLKKWNGVVNPIILEYRARQGEARTLAILRDTLLPKLMSGKLSVIETKEQVTQ